MRTHERDSRESHEKTTLVGFTDVGIGEASPLPFFPNKHPFITRWGISRTNFTLIWDVTFPEDTDA